MNRFVRFFFYGWTGYLLTATPAAGQQDSLVEVERINPIAGFNPHPVSPPIQINRFNLELGMDVYTAYGLNDTGSELPEYFYSYNRQGEVNLNLGYLRGSYVDNRFKAQLGLMAGTYANASLAAEPGSLRNLLEAYVGVSLKEGNRTWLEAGVFDSHIGFESPIGFDQLALTRGILSENTPYYLSGVRLLHRTKNGKWHLGLLVLNGWQIIQKPYGDRMPAFGHTLTYFVNDNWSLHSNSYVGKQLGVGTTVVSIAGLPPFEVPEGNVLGTQLMHDFYAEAKLGERLNLVLGCDLGQWQDELDLSDLGNSRFWYSPSLVASYTTGEHSRLVLRLEHFNDNEAALVAIVGTRRLNPFDFEIPALESFVVTGASLNYDYNLSAFAKWRIEARGLYSQNSIFPKTFGSNAPNANTLVFFTTSLSVRLFK